MQLKNADPKFKYVHAVQGGHDINSVSYYRSIGYEVCITPTKDQERTATTYLTGPDSKPGEALMQMDLVTMRISIEDAQDIEDYGRYGSGGQAHADVLEMQLANQAEALRYADTINRGDKTYFEFQNLGRGEQPLKHDEAQGDISLGREG